MGQLKITEMFSPNTPSSKHSHSSVPVTNERSKHRSIQLDATKRKRQGVVLSTTLSSQKSPCQTPSQSTTKIPQSNLSPPSVAGPVSIPSTPLSPMPDVESKFSNKNPGRRSEKIPETPQSATHSKISRPPVRRIPAPRTPVQRTPNKPILSELGDSPFTPIDISSTDTSECEIPRNLPISSKKRKQNDLTPTKVQPSKRARAKGSASEPRPKVQAKPKSSSKPKSSGTARNRASSLTPRTVTPPRQSNAAHRVPTSSAPRYGQGSINAALRANAIPDRASSRVENADDSDCIIEKVQPSPKKRRQSKPANVLAKKRRIGKDDDSLVAINRQVADQESDEDCKIIKVILLPTKSASTSTTRHFNSNASNTDSQPQNRSCETPVSKTQQTPLNYSRTVISQSMATNRIPLTSPRPIKEHAVIDLTQDSSSDDSDTFPSAVKQRKFVKSDSPLPLDVISSVQCDAPVIAFHNTEIRHDNAAKDDGAGHRANAHPEKSGQNQKRQSHNSGRVWRSGPLTGHSLAPIPTRRRPPIKIERSPELDEEEEVVSIFECTDQSCDEIENDKPFIKAEQDLTNQTCDESENVQSSVKVTHDFVDQAFGESEDAQPVIKAQQDLSYDSWSPISYDASDEDSDDECGPKSSPPPSFQPPASCRSFQGTANASYYSKSSPDAPSKRSASKEVRINDQIPNAISTISKRAATNKSQESPVTPSSTRDPQRQQYGSFKPCHDLPRNGLKGVLKAVRSCPDRRTKHRVRFSSPPCRQVASSPSERIQHTKEDAKARRSSNPQDIQRCDKTSTPVTKRSTSANPRLKPLFAKSGDLTSRIIGGKRSKSTVDTISRQDTTISRKGRDKANHSETLVKVEINTEVADSCTKQKGHRVANAKESRGKAIGQGPRPVLMDNVALKPRDFMPSVIRDGVSEHAIKSTAILYEKKAAASKIPVGERQGKNPGRFKPDWSIPVIPRRGAQAMGAELERRGIRNDRQYGNFWYNLSKRFSKSMGSTVPLFTAHKKALELVVEESMSKERKRRLQKTEETQAQKPEAKSPVGVDAFKLYGAGETDKESSSSESVSAEELIARIRENEKRKGIRGGTSQ